MGLESGEHGAKSTILGMLQYLDLSGEVPQGATTVPQLNALHAQYGVNRTNVAIVADGNVMLRAVPRLSYKEYASFLEREVHKLADVAKHVVIVFDDPSCLTTAKREEQSSRDANQKKKEIVSSDDVKCLPQTEFYSEEDIVDVSDVTDLVVRRATRIRLMDIVFCKIFANMNRVASQQARLLGAAPLTLTLDGIDKRGGRRPQGDARAPCIMSTDDRMSDVLRRDGAIGEGDMKMAAVEDAIERHRRRDGSIVKTVGVVLTHTIDTDSLMIHLISAAERASRDVDDFASVLCLKERGRKRKQGDDGSSPYYNVVDMQKLLKTFLLMLFGADTPYTRRMQREAVALVALGTAACGCDYNRASRIKGLRANEMYCILSDYMKHTTPHSLERMRGAWSNDTDATRTTIFLFQDVLRLYSQSLSRGSYDVPRMLSFHKSNGTVTKQRMKLSESLVDCDENYLLRAAWTAAYWSGHEFTDTHNFGFHSIVTDVDPDLDAR